jgi:LAS superfamily LD-carboxypeptidase LdcB
MLTGGSVIPVAAPPATGAASAGDLESYLAATGVRQRNGRLDPAELVPVSGGWDRPARLLEPAARAWETMRSAAAAQGVDLRVVDSYRDFDAQAAGHVAYLEGRKDAYVAPPGESEHGVGLAIDVTNGALVGPGDREWEWLQANGRQFGWHPISTESWHWEFRGA